MCLIARASVNHGVAISSSKGLQRGVSVCAFLFLYITAVPITKLFAWGEGDS